MVGNTPGVAALGNVIASKVRVPEISDVREATRSLHCSVHRCGFLVAERLVARNARTQAVDANG